MQRMTRRELLQWTLGGSAAACMPMAALPLLHGEAPARFQPVRERIRQAIQQGSATGVAVAVVSRGQTLWAEGFGMADRELGVAVTPETPFSLASITKSFTATLVATLAAEGLCRLDGPASSHLRATPLSGPNGDPAAVTIRMLGAHCSGLPGTFAAYLSGGPVPAPSTASYLHDYGRLAYPPGEVYEYGNIGYEALGAIATTLCGESFSLALDRRVLQPLGLRNSFFSDAEDRVAKAAARYDANARRIPPYQTSTPPSGELYASVNDMARFASFNLGHLQAGVRSILEPRWLRELHAPVITGGSGVAASFGWFTGNLATGEPYLFKGGGQPGVAAKIFVLPSKDVACVVLTNRTDGKALVEESCQAILRNYVPGFVVPDEDAGPEPREFHAAAHWVGTWTGRLRNGGADQPVRLVIPDNGAPTLALSGRPAQAVGNLKIQGDGFEGFTRGLIDCTDGAAFGERDLVLKLVPHGRRLVGRVTARGTRPGLLLANIPYVLTLDRER